MKRDDQEIAALIFPAGIPEYVYTRDTDSVWFDDLSPSRFNALVQRGVIENDSTDVIPEVSALREFITEYPECRLFGWLQQLRADALPTVFITGLRLEHPTQTEVAEWRDIDTESYQTLKTDVFKRFDDALRLELTPECVEVNYCWTPEMHSD